MLKLRTHEEVKKLLVEVNIKYWYYLFKRGIDFGGLFTAEDAAEVQGEYNLPESISDLELGRLEGQIGVLKSINARYNSPNDDHIIRDYATPSLMTLPANYINNRGNFIRKVAEVKPEIIQHPEDSSVRFNTEPLTEPMPDWLLTEREFGELCGGLSAATWVFGIKWTPKENDGDNSTVHWDKFYEFLASQSAELKSRDVIETHYVFQDTLNKIKDHKAETETM